MITQNKLYWREQTMEDKKEKLPSKTLTARKQFIESSLKPLKTLAFKNQDFFAFMVIMFK